MNTHYWNRYLKFIESCDGQTLHSSFYYEKHHIIPKSWGGDNSEDNLIKLTPRQHYLAHYLLMKAQPCSQTYYAVAAMNMDHTGQRIYKSSELNVIRHAYYLSSFGKNNPNYGNTWTEEQRDRMRGENNPAKRPEVKEKISNTIKQKWADDPESMMAGTRAAAAREISDEERARKSEAMSGENNPMYGKPRTESDRSKMKAGWAERNQKNVVPHNTDLRYHIFYNEKTNKYIIGKLYLLMENPTKFGDNITPMQIYNRKSGKAKSALNGFKYLGTVDS